MDAAQLIATLYPHLCKTIFWPPVEATKYLEQGLFFDQSFSHTCSEKKLFSMFWISITSESYTPD